MRCINSNAKVSPFPRAAHSRCTSMIAKMIMKAITPSMCLNMKTEALDLRADCLDTRKIVLVQNIVAMNASIAISEYKKANSQIPFSVFTIQHQSPLSPYLPANRGATAETREHPQAAT